MWNHIPKIKSKGIHLPIHHMVMKYYRYTFPQTWKKPRWILAKACLPAKNYVLFKRNLEVYIKEAYFDKYEGIQSEISQAIKFDESTDLSTTYLGRVGQTRKSVIRAE